MLFQYWKLFYEYYSAVARAPISLQEKIISFGYLVKRTVWARIQLTGDIKQAIAEVNLSKKGKR